MTYDVKIDGASQFVIAGSLQVQSSIGRRSTASFVAKTATATVFKQYQPVQIKSGVTNVFTGFIADPQMQKPGYQPSLIHTIQCTDGHYLADKRIIAATWSNQTVGAIALSIFTNYLQPEGVTLGQIYDPSLYPSLTLYPSTILYPEDDYITVPTVTFSYCTVAQALDALVQRAGNFYWSIDENNQFWFVPYTSVINSTIVDGTQIDLVQNPPKVKRHNPTYRNKQYIIGGTGTTVAQNESRKGDGQQTAFTMSYDLAQVPTITLNGAAQTVGIKVIDSGKDWYWSKGDPVIAQDSAGTKLTSSDTLAVTYVGQYPIVVVVQDDAQIAAEQALEGGTTTGIVESVENNSTIQSSSEGFALGGQLLVRYSPEGVSIDFYTLQTGFQAGQLVTVDLPDFGIDSAQMLIESVTATDGVDGVNLWYNVVAVSGPYDTTWVAFFSNLVAGAQGPISVGTSQNIALAAPFTIAASPSLSFSANVYACPIPNTTLQPSTSLFPC